MLSLCQHYVIEHFAMVEMFYNLCCPICSHVWYGAHEMWLVQLKNKHFLTVFSFNFKFKLKQPHVANGYSMRQKTLDPNAFYFLVFSFHL